MYTISIESALTIMPYGGKRTQMTKVTFLGTEKNVPVMSIS